MTGTEFKSTNNQNFEIAPYWGILNEIVKSNEKYISFKVGNIKGAFRALDSQYQILAVFSNRPGSGHMKDVLEWFENSCKRDNYDLVINDVVNPRLVGYLHRNGFSIVPDSRDMIKHQKNMK